MGCNLCPPSLNNTSIINAIWHSSKTLYQYGPAPRCITRTCIRTGRINNYSKNFFKDIFYLLVQVLAPIVSKEKQAETLDQLFDYDCWCTLFRSYSIFAEYCELQHTNNYE